MNRHDEALEVLLILRRRLLDRMARVIVENREKLLNGTSRTNNPLASSADIADMIRNLGEVDRAISGLADLVSGNGSAAGAVVEGNGNGRGECGVFSRFVELVRAARFEEASRNLQRHWRCRSTVSLRRHASSPDRSRPIHRRRCSSANFNWLSAK
ncbi:MAG: hypothetical protein IPK83_13050 [Planctomycetes bacterium]|nr:hypothetical protein [Planctomycetota bacterium]